MQGDIVKSPATQKDNDMDKYIDLALQQYWIDNPTDCDIPFIGLPDSAQYIVKSRATLMQLEDERQSLRGVLDYTPVNP